MGKSAENRSWGEEGMVGVEGQDSKKVAKRKRIRCPCVPPNRLPARCCPLQPNYSTSNESAGQGNDGPQRQAAACTR